MRRTAEQRCNIHIPSGPASATVAAARQRTDTVRAMTDDGLFARAIARRVGLSERMVFSDQVEDEAQAVIQANPDQLTALARRSEMRIARLPRNVHRGEPEGYSLQWQHRPVGTSLAAWDPRHPLLEQCVEVTYSVPARRISRSTS
jgi:hypothetical protein